MWQNQTETTQKEHYHSNDVSTPYFVLNSTRLLQLQQDLKNTIFLRTAIFVLEAVWTFVCT